MSEQELQETVETCWRVAAASKLPGISEGMVVGVDVLNQIQLNMIRLSIFNQLIQSQTMHRNFNSVHRVEHPKEPWQNGDAD